MSRLNDSELPFSLLQFYNTAEYPCSYLSGERAISQVATPTHLITTEVYGELVRNGFRRSGVFSYRPDCEECHACVPVRLPIARFAPRRNQRRSLKAHATLHARELPLMFFDEHYRLYLRYQAARHLGGGMDQDNHEQYSRFLLQSRIDSRLICGGVRCVCSMATRSEKTALGVPSAMSLPFHMTSARCVTWAIKGMSWETQMTVSPRSPRRSMSRLIALVVR